MAANPSGAGSGITREPRTKLGFCCALITLALLSAGLFGIGPSSGVPVPPLSPGLSCSHPTTVSNYSCPEVPASPRLSSSANPTWSNLTTGVAPSPRDGFVTTYDAADGSVLLFGGATLPGGDYLSDTWTFRSGVWSNITATAGTPPSPRVGYAMAYDAADGYVILAGGQSPIGTQLSDVWEFHGGQWSELSASGFPASLQNSCGVQAAFDTTDNFTMFLGASCNGGATGGAAMAYEGGSWTNPDLNQTTGPNAPVPGYEEGALANDPQLHGLVFFGGYDHTFVYTAGSWIDESGNLTGVPAPQVDAGMAYDTAQGGVLLFGGFRQVRIGEYTSPDRLVLGQHDVDQHHFRPNPSPRALRRPVGLGPWGQRLDLVRNRGQLYLVVGRYPAVGRARYPGNALARWRGSGRRVLFHARRRQGSLYVRMDLRRRRGQCVV